ncbi:MAG TPA: YqgE/AlgH family protein [Bryobacteraceae bacterium]|nr:YqgE/AlgH family protein [Bryobacteraceae bacterium]
MSRIRLSNTWIVLIFAGALCQAQELAAGKLLIATRKSVDPDLAKSVVLLVGYEQRGVIGLVVNHPSNVVLPELFPALKPGQAPVYKGGPIALGTRALLRSPSKPGPGMHVFGDVSMISNRRVMEDVLRAGASPSSFRVYAGYVGWSTQQLKNEIAQGLWRVLPPDANVVFNPDPEKVWGRLITR